MDELMRLISTRLHPGSFWGSFEAEPGLGIDDLAYSQSSPETPVALNAPFATDSCWKWIGSVALLASLFMKTRECYDRTSENNRVSSFAVHCIHARRANFVKTWFWSWISLVSSPYIYLAGPARGPFTATRCQ